MEVDRKWCLVYGIGEVEKVFGSSPGEWAGKEPPRMPHVENVETVLPLDCCWTALTSLLPLFPLINILIGFWGTAGGGAGASASPISEKKSSCDSPFWHHTHTHTHIDIVWQPQSCICRDLSRAEPVIARRWQEDGRTLESVLRSRGIGWKRGKPRRALRPGLSWDSTSRLLRLTLTLLSQLLLLIIGYAETNKFTNILRCSTTKQIATALRQNTILSANFY